jgi:hypothetical protein
LIDRHGLETVVNLGRTWVCQLPVVEADAEKYDDIEPPSVRERNKVYSFALKGLSAVKRAET